MQVEQKIYANAILAKAFLNASFRSYGDSPYTYILEPLSLNTPLNFLLLHTEYNAHRDKYYYHFQIFWKPWDENSETMQRVDTVEEFKEAYSLQLLAYQGD